MRSEFEDRLRFKGTLPSRSIISASVPSAASVDSVTVAIVNLAAKVQRVYVLILPQRGAEGDRPGRYFCPMQNRFFLPRTYIRPSWNAGQVTQPSPKSVCRTRLTPARDGSRIQHLPDSPKI